MLRHQIDFENSHERIICYPRRCTYCHEWPFGQWPIGGRRTNYIPNAETFSHRIFGLRECWNEKRRWNTSGSRFYFGSTYKEQYCGGIVSWFVIFMRISLPNHNFEWFTSRLVINSDSPGYTVFGNTTSFDMHLTFIEIFDTSVDGLSGGNVQWLSGDVGSFEFQLAVTPLSASQPLRMYIVVYAVNEHWAGRNYRFGYYRADLQLLSL